MVNGKMTEVAIKILRLVTHSIHHLVGFISIFNLLPLDQFQMPPKLLTLVCAIIILVYNYAISLHDFLNHYQL